MNKAKSNIALLTEGAAYIRRAKAARQDQVEEIKFDDEARKEWLTGFSKRKKAKVEEKRARAKERDRQAHVDERRKARQELKERAAQNVRDVRAAMGLEAANEKDEEEDDEAGATAEAGPSRPRQDQAEFSDEDQLATVTITEDFDPSSLPLSNPLRSSTTPEPERTIPKPVALMPPSSGRAMAKAKKEQDRVKEKKKREKEKSRSMETKAERKKGKSIEAKKRGHKATMAIERDGKTKGRFSGGKKGGGSGKKGGGARGKGGPKGKK